MPSIIERIVITVEVLMFIPGIWGNGFIVLVICTDWAKTKKISCYDFMLISFGISRIAMLCVITEDSIRSVFYPEICDSDHERVVGIIIDFIWNLSNSFNTWCTACLGIFYVFKLSSFSHPLFLWLKWRRDRIFLAIQLGFLLSLVGNILSIKYDYNWVSECLKMKRNVTWQKGRHQEQYFRNHTILNLGSFVALALSLISFILLIFSLARHVQRMMQHSSGSGGFNTEVSVRARNTMASFLILLIMHYLSTFLIIWAYTTVESLILVLVMETLAVLYSVVHSFIIIQGNRRLKQTFVNLQRKVEFCIKGI